MRTTKEIARYVGKKYTTTGAYIGMAILTLSLPVPIRPTAPVTVGTLPTVDIVDHIQGKNLNVCQDLVGSRNHHEIHGRPNLGTMQ
jgi:hypothetical protein